MLPVGLSTAPREFTETLAPLAQLLHTRGIRVHAYLDDHPCGLTRPECSSYTTDYPAFTNLGMDYQLEEVYTRNFTHSRRFGSALQSITSNCFFTRLLLRSSHQCPIPSINVHCHACMQNNFYQQSDLSLFPLYPSRPPTAQVPPVLDKEMLVPTHTALGHPDLTGFGISHTSTLVQQKRSTSRSPTAFPGTLPVLLHRCVTDRMGSQLADPSSLRTVVTSRALTAYQLAGTGSDKISHTSVGTSVAQSDCWSVLRQ